MRVSNLLITHNTFAHKTKYSLPSVFVKIVILVLFLLASFDTDSKTTPDSTTRLFSSLKVDMGYVQQITGSSHFGLYQFANQGR
jgi:hypothetical protein